MLAVPTSGPLGPMVVAWLLVSVVVVAGVPTWREPWRGGALLMIDLDDFEAVGRRVIGALVGPASLRAGAVVLRAGIGLRRVPGLDHDVLALTRDADAALCRARREGGCRVRLAAVGEGDGTSALAGTLTSARRPCTSRTFDASIIT